MREKEMEVKNEMCVVTMFVHMVVLKDETACLLHISYTIFLPVTGFVLANCTAGKNTHWKTLTSKC